MQIKLVLALLIAVGMTVSPSTAFEQSIRDGVVQQSPDPLNPVIDRLSWCESRDNEYAVNPHDGGSASYGRFQFKEATWHYYLDRYGLFPDVERAERMNLIWDGYSQEIATRLVLSEKGGWANWFNCLKGFYEY